MNISATETQTPRATDISVSEDTLTVDLSDGRSISVALLWYPRLTHGNAEERNHWELISEGEGIHWPDLDEHLSVEGLLDGRPSGESQRSFRRWLEAKHAGRPLTLDALREHERREQVD